MSVKISPALDGAVVRIALACGKGNVVDAKAMEALEEAFAEASAEGKVRAVLLEGDGPDFSFGMSVPEHAPEVVGTVLPRFHRLIGQMLHLPVPLLVATKGRCLGGALELALAGSRLFAAAGSSFGLPEVKLAVFAPAGSALLPERVGQARAEELLLSGRTVDAEEALRIGLVDELAPDPAEAALAYVRARLQELSPTAIRFAHRAARLHFARAAIARLGELEKLYLEQLMQTHDAKEGLAAFMAKRKPTYGVKAEGPR